MYARRYTPGNSTTSYLLCSCLSVDDNPFVEPANNKSTPDSHRPPSFNPGARCYNVVAHTQQTAGPGCNYVAMYKQIRTRLLLAVERHVVPYR